MRILHEILTLTVAYKFLIPNKTLLWKSPDEVHRCTCQCHQQHKATVFCERKTQSRKVSLAWNIVTKAKNTGWDLSTYIFLSLYKYEFGTLANWKSGCLFLHHLLWIWYLLVCFRRLVLGLLVGIKESDFLTELSSIVMSVVWPVRTLSCFTNWTRDLGFPFKRSVHNALHAM